MPGKANAPEASSPAQADQVEYSSREVKPASLLLQDLLRAHAVFLLHHASSLSALFVRTQRVKFVSILTRYWDQFLSTWNVLLHGNPACSVFGGVKVAACGELGMGVGEEERGSGERDALEDLIGRTEGLVDLVVGKYGDHDSIGDGGSQDAEQWIGTGNEPGAEDGAIFLGVGALSRHSLRAITYWMEDMYSWAESAYGVQDSPSSTRSHPKKKRSAARRAASSQAASPGTGIGTLPEVLQDSGASGSVSGKPPKPDVGGEQEGGMDKIFNYLKLGYGTSWSLTGSPSAESPDPTSGRTGKTESGADAATSQKQAGSSRFLVGLMGDVDGNSTGSEQDGPSSQDQAEDPNPNSRTLVRTLSVELESEDGDRPESGITKDLGSQDTELTEHKVDAEGHVTEAANLSFESQDRNKSKKLRVVVYAARPFIFVFLFQPRTESLAWEAMYRSLHTQLIPIRKPLLQSTRYRPERPDMGAISAQIYDLIWDPQDLTIHSTIPNIPDPIVPGTPVPAQVWSRVEALNTHNHILNVYMGTRENLSEFERTCKTSRGWWVVWNRVLEPAARGAEGETQSESIHERRPSDGSNFDETEVGDGSEGGKPLSMQDLVVSKEILLIRRASDHASGARGVSSSYASAAGVGTGGGWADGASRLAQGIGVDTRRYIEGLLSLNR